MPAILVGSVVFLFVFLSGFMLASLNILLIDNLICSVY